MNDELVGGGVSGLYAAYTLKNLGYDVLILEASARRGTAAASIPTPWATWASNAARKNSTQTAART